MIGKLMMGTKAGGDPRRPNGSNVSRDEPDLMRGGARGRGLLGRPLDRGDGLR